MAETPNTDLVNLEGTLRACSTDAERFSFLLDAARAAARAERGFVLKRSAPEVDPVVMAAVGVKPESLFTTADISQYILYKVFTEGQPVHSDNAATDPRFSERNSVVLGGLRSVLCVPLKSGDQVTGLVYLDNRFIAGLFSDEMVERVKQIAELASRALG